VKFLPVSELRQMLSDAGIRPKKELGQNFLIDHNIIRKMIADEGGDLALDIGCGPGIMTLPLSYCYHKVLAVEIDERFRPILQDVLSDRDNVQIIFDDAREIEWSGHVNDDYGQVAVYGNLPYGAAPPIMHNVLCSVNWEEARFMLQYEVGERLEAEPGSKAYSPLTLSIRFRADTEILHRVKKNSFYPSPDVDSALVKLSPRQQPEAVSFSQFMQVVRASFAMRRKTLRNSLAKSRELDLDSSDASEVLEAAGIDSGRRAETVCFDEYVQLTKEIARAGKC